MDSLNHVFVDFMIVFLNIVLWGFFRAVFSTVAYRQKGIKQILSIIVGNMICVGIPIIVLVGYFILVRDVSVNLAICIFGGLFAFFVIWSVCEDFRFVKEFKKGDKGIE